MGGIVAGVPSTLYAGSILWHRTLGREDQGLSAPDQVEAVGGAHPATG
jgi:hypothetical protein